MMTISKYAAIDIGSNAVRLLISNIIEEKGKETRFKKSSLVRVPIRLGQDVFYNGEISERNKSRMLDTMQAFMLLMKSHGVTKYKACATSAMREALNGKELVETVLGTSQVNIDIINGHDEATIIASTDLKTYIKPNKTYLYVDVGGGSTEFSVFHLGEIVASKSFKIGTVRLLNDQVKDSDWENLESWIKSTTKSYNEVQLIGSGGNINKIFKMSGMAMGKPLSYFYLSTFLDTITNMSYEDRISELDLNTDRADVILPATRIYLSAMKWSKGENIYVPKIGLSDGIIKSMFFNKITSIDLPLG